MATGNERAIDPAEPTDLMRSMDEGLEEKKAEMRRKAGEAAKAIRCDAKTRAGEIRKARMAEAVASAVTERNHALYAAKNSDGMEMTALKYRLFDRAFAEAGRMLPAVRDREGYAACYGQLVAEALDGLGDVDRVLHVDPRDAGLAGQCVRCDIVPDLSCAGGLNASTRDGNVVILNTLEARLGRAKDRLKLEVFAWLFGD